MKSSRGKEDYQISKGGVSSGLFESSHAAKEMLMQTLYWPVITPGLFVRVSTYLHLE